METKFPVKVRNLDILTLMLHIAILIPSAAGGGVEKVAILLANEFASRGIRTDLLIGNLEGPNLKSVHPDVRLVNLRAPKLRMGIFSLWRYIRENRPTVLFSRMHHTLLFAELVLMGLHRKPIHIGSVHNVPLATKVAGKKMGFRERIKTRVDGMIFRRLDHLVGVSRGVSDDYRLLHGIRPDRLSTIYNPINLGYIRSQAAQSPSHNWYGKNFPVVLAAGRLVPQKGFQTLLNAFPEVHKKTKARLIILGDGVLRPSLEAQVEQLGLRDVVDLPGYQMNPYSYMAASDVFVLSSIHEGLGNVLLESLAVGTPIVATNCPSGPAEIIDGNKWGALVPVGDASALAQAIVKSLQESHDAGHLMERAEMFGIEKISEQYLGLVRKLLN